MHTLLRSLSRNQKIALQVIVDVGLMVFSYVVAMCLRLESLQFLLDPMAYVPLLITVPLTLAAFFVFGLYRTVIRHLSSDVLVAIGTGAVVSTFALEMSSVLVSAPIPLSVPFIYLSWLFLSIASARFLARRFLRYPLSQSRKRVVIYGAGDAGSQLLVALQNGREYAPMALVDDSRDLQKMTVCGLRVYAPDAIEDVLRKTGARDILLAIPSASRMRLREIVATLENINVDVKTIPGMADLVSGRAEISELRRITPEDLLGRDPVAPQEALLRKHITGKVVLISGAGGSIGMELCRQIIALDPTALILYEVSEFGLYQIDRDLRETLAQTHSPTRLIPILGSVQHPNRTQAVLNAFNVQTVFHAAAYKHVPLVEENIVEGIRNNVFGTLTIARAAQTAGVENFILISTDKAVRPTNVMGASKRMAELICQALAKQPGSTTFSMVRFGNVLGSSGSVIPKFRSQIEKGGPITVTHRDITRYFMTIPEAAQLVIQASAMAQGGDVFVLDMGPPVKILDLAISMVRLHGLTPYVVENNKDIDHNKDGIAICFTGLRKGEKLYEELLISHDAKKTSHPRIMTASETSLDLEDLEAILARLKAACEALNVAAIRAILLEAPLSYSPTSGEISDRVWTAVQGQAAM